MQITSNPAINSISLYVYMDKDIIYAPQYDTMKMIKDAGFDGEIESTDH